MKRTSRCRTLTVLTSLLFLLFVLILPVSADMGPKPADYHHDGQPTGRGILP